MYYDEVELFLLDTGEFIEATTIMKNYVAMPAESKARYVERVILDVTRRCSPRKNYGITRDVLRAYVIDVLAGLEKEFQQMTSEGEI